MSYCWLAADVGAWHAQVVPPKQMTLQELSQYDGSIAGKPMYLAIRGTVFDVTTGEHSFMATSVQLSVQSKWQLGSPW